MNRYFHQKKSQMWTLKYCQDSEQFACSDEQALFWDLRDKPDKMLDRNKRYSNSVGELEPRIRTQTGGKKAFWI